MKCFFSVALIILLSSCTYSTAFEIEKASSFDRDVFNELRTHRNVLLSDIVDNGNTSFIYTVNNECAQCISDFFDFNEVINNQISHNVNIIYLIYGYDKINFEYYMDRNQTKINPQFCMIYDTVDVFHNRIHDYYSNNLFFIDKEKEIYRIKSLLPEYQWDFSELQKAIDNK